MPNPTTPASTWRPRRLALAGILGIVVGVIVGGLVVRGPAPGPSIPDPNGFDDLLASGLMIRGDWPKQGDVDRADPAEARAFVAANTPALERALLGLGRECLVVIDDSRPGLDKHFESSGRIKKVARLLTAEGVAAQDEGRVVDASRSLRDVLRVGQAATQGGMLTDAQLGWSVQGVAIARVRKLRDRLDSEGCRAVLRDLEDLDRRRVPPGAVVDRWERWYRQATGTPERVMLRWSGTEATERTTQQVQAARAHREVARAMRFLMVELAIHAYHLDKGSWPRSVAELVPAYLASAPSDPATGATLDYPANASGELTDDLDAIARPDVEAAPRS